MADFQTNLIRMIEAQRISKGGSSKDATTAQRAYNLLAHAAKAARKDNNTELSVYLPYSNTVLVDAPIGYWRMGEAAGPFVDTGSGGNNLVITGTVTLGQTSAIYDGNTSALFDGATGFASKAVDPFSGLAACSIEAWVNHKGVAWSAGLEQVCNPGPTGHYLAISNGSVFCSLRISTTQRTVTGTAVSVTGWHHVALTWTSGDFIRLYLDGVQVGISGSTFAGTLDASTAGFGVGCFNSPGPASSFFNGLIDEVAVYNTQLSVTQIAAHYAVR